MNLNFSKKLKKSTKPPGYAGFTLAEILLTLLIIGVVAALTIPTLITNLNDMQFRSAWKKNYSRISEAIDQIKEQEVLSNQELNNLLRNTDFFNTTFAEKYRVMFEPGYNHSFFYPIKYLNGTDAGEMAQDYSGMFALIDGTIIVDKMSANDEIFIDVNGGKGPNIIGRDIFLIAVNENNYELVPYGFGLSTIHCGQGGNDDDGKDCSLYYLRN